MYIIDGKKISEFSNAESINGEEIIPIVKDGNNYVIKIKNLNLGISVVSVNGKSGIVILEKSDIGLGNVDNTADADKPVSMDVQQALNLKQDLIEFTPENISNKSNNINLGDSDILYPTQNAVKQYVDGKTIFVQTSDKSVSNTTNETSIIGTGVGSITIPANRLVAGKTYRIIANGYASGTNGVGLTVKIKLGSTIIGTNSSSLPSALSNTGFELQYKFTCRSTGTNGSAIGQGGSIVATGQGFATNTLRAIISTSPVTIDTTVDHALDITEQWAVASTGNSITITNLIIEELR